MNSIKHHLNKDILLGKTDDTMKLHTSQKPIKLLHFVIFQKVKYLLCDVSIILINPFQHWATLS